MFDYRDGVSWHNSSSSIKGGPLGGTGDGVWNRDAIVAEKTGFDCAKGHPAMGNYHHHQNPSAFNLDLTVISNVCNLYVADGLYVINASTHSPLLGFAYDGFPIYGAYGYKNADGTGGITRIKSSYSLRNITVRNTYSSGSSVTAGPAVSTTYPLGYFREDYQYTAPTSADYLDEHNGRFCITPEYPSGTYAYFCTVDANHNSAYPYAVGPTFYGNKVVTKVTSITEPTTTYTGPILASNEINLDGYLKDEKPVLRWTTTTIKDADYFELQSSSDGKNFSITTKQKASNTTGNNYSYTDEVYFTDTRYYRIRQVNYDGTYFYSKVVSLNKSIRKGDISIYPNPVNDLMVVQSRELLQNTMEIAVLNVNGQVVKHSQFPQGSTLCYIETGELTNGTYFLSVTGTSTKKVYKVVVNH